MDEAKFVLGLELFIAWIVVACYGVYSLMKILKEFIIIEWEKIRGK